MGERDPQESARERQRERAEAAESAASDGRFGEMLSEHKYPATSEELAVDYGGEPIDMPNETESVGSVFDRLEGERFETAEEAEEALYNELTGSNGGPEEYNDGRDLDAVDESVSEGEQDQPEGSL
ncbi:DUF5789 family protein [Halalkalicoccus jeotgali]|uniref:DUF2795 domain-containing protein n=1 Tax=Halalkalicoccus jeotgali (strain DSM 18796 / CECT 7217 / JCM 14584 / KCTC 4019 / B3) TaxID=795797 RepID=D8J4H9_HALJB|nr:hypothetical protein [Halalkalicoccus jeotgali]ADJ13541.1 hypothetical protein HacjB3_00740 [Halalkalicoccus jeotgali B3]ELY32984.1 hypothetical protein C497_18592 [Halalkalicoccus jeotgali B3]